MTKNTIEDATLAELIVLFVTKPAKTWKAWKAFMSESTEPLQATTVNTRTPAEANQRQWLAKIFALPKLQLLLFGVAVAIGFHGNTILRGTGNRPAADGPELAAGSPYLWLAILVWLFAEFIGHWAELRQAWQRLDRISRYRWVARIFPVTLLLSAYFPLTDSMTATGESVLGLLVDVTARIMLAGVIWIAINLATGRMRQLATLSSSKNVSPSTALAIKWREKGTSGRPWRRIQNSRIILLVLACGTSLLVWANTTNNTFVPSTICLWFSSALLWSLVFAPARWNLFDWAADRIDSWRRFDWRGHRWEVISFVAIMMLGAVFRFAQLDTLPGEMYPDHAYAIKDAYRISQGQFNIMFVPQPDAREPLHYYLVAILAGLPGLGFNHFTLKLVAALESLITLPLLFWAGLELFGERRRKFGLLVGLMVAGLVAVSYWHVVISRYALRTHLTVPFVALMIIYLARALRHNRRSDFVACGLVLGFSIYAYTASRVLPLAVVAGVVIALVMRRRPWREWLSYVLNLALIAFISLMIFLPMLHFSVDNPQSFWNQVGHHMMGPQRSEDLTDADTVAVLLNNIRNALLMFNWQGDGDWIHSANREPALDNYSSTFLLLGLAAGAVYMLKKPDPAIWMIPVVAIVTLLPSALALYSPWVNPDNTRAGGAIPAIYLIASLPIATIAMSMSKAFPKRVGKVLPVLFCGAVIGLAADHNRTVYFDHFADRYALSARPYTELGSVLRGFAESDGAYANAFVGTWDWGLHSAVALETGADPMVSHRVMRVQDIPGNIQTAKNKTEPFRLKADRDLLFIYRPDLEEYSTRLREWFPNGRETQRQAYNGKPYVLYRVPALGEAGLNDFIRQYS